jgi:hypothetical protein
MVYFMAIWSIYGRLVYCEATSYILWLFGIYSPILICCPKKILATLLLIQLKHSRVAEPCQFAEQGRIGCVEVQQALGHVHLPAVDVRQDLEQLVVREVGRSAINVKELETRKFFNVKDTWRQRCTLGVTSELNFLF